MAIIVSIPSSNRFVANPKIAVKVAFWSEDLGVNLNLRESSTSPGLSSGGVLCLEGLSGAVSAVSCRKRSIKSSGVG